MPDPVLKASSKVAVRQAELAGFDTLSNEDLACFVWSDVRPLQGVAGLLDWRMCGQLSSALKRHEFRGQLGEVVLVPLFGRAGPRRVFIFGLGTAAGTDAGVLRQVCSTAAEVLHRAGCQHAVLCAPQAWGRGDFETAFVNAVGAAVMPQTTVWVERVFSGRTKV